MGTKEDANLINEAIADPVPAMEGVPQVTAELIQGIYDPKKEVWHTDAEVRELTGEDEEYLAALENKKGLLYSEYMNALLSRAVTRIGTINVNAMNGKQLVNQLMLGDRDLLYMAVVKATYGETRLINIVCSKCEVKNDVEIMLDEDFPVTYPDFDVREGLKVETSKGVVTLRLPTGEDTVIAQKEADNDAALNTVMLSRCAMWPEGEAPESPMKWARSLNIGDRKKLINTLLEVEVGPKMGEVDTQCASCGEDMPILLDWVSLLLS